MKCPHCNTEIEPGYDSCRKCGHRIDDSLVEPQPQPADDALFCLRCNTPLDYKGKFDFQEGSHWGFWGNFFELLENNESFHIYVCPGCGKAEFYTFTNRN